MDQDSIINCINDNGIDGVVMLSGDTHTAAIDDGGSGGVAEIMAGALSQSNSSLYTTAPLLPFGLEWNQGGQGINGNLNLNDAFGKITIQGDDWVRLQLIDENGNQVVSYTKYSCSYQSGLTLTTGTVQNVLCYGDSSGSITLLASGGTPPYTYTIDGGETFQASATFGNLPKGRYVPAVRDASGCTKELCIHIEEPLPFVATATVVRVSCIGAADGAIDLLAAGGVPPYSYIWPAGDTTAQVNNLLPGNYAPTVTDANGCLQVLNLQITEPDSLFITAQVTEPTCYLGGNGLISLTPFGGTPPITIQWSDNRTGPNRNGLSPGTYYYTLQDSRGCTRTDSVVVRPGNPFTITATITGDDGTTNGSATLQASGGTGPYTYTWFDGSTGPSISGLPTGTFPVTISDATGCSQDTSITIGIQVVGIKNLTTALLEFFPNPVKGVLQIAATLPTAEAITIKIYDMGGRELLMQNFDATQKLSTRLDLSDLPAGNVLVELKTENYRVHKKLLILE